MKKKGFTLVELLAVIAILAILVIIAMPNVLEMFNKAKQDAFETEVQSHIKAVTTEFIITGQLVYSNVVSGAAKLPMDGEELDYYIVLDTKGNIKTLNVTNGEYKIEASGSSDNPIRGDQIGDTIQSETAPSGEEFAMNSTGSITGDNTNPGLNLNNVSLDVILPSSETSPIIAVGLTNSSTVDGLSSVKYEIYVDNVLVTTLTSTNKADNFKTSTPDIITNYGISHAIRVVAKDSNGNNLKTGNYTFTPVVCFVAGTKVYTDKGQVNIEDIKVGDMVYSFNLNNNTRELKEVLNTITSSTKTIYKMTIGSEVLEMSPRHELYIVDKGWVRAFDVKEGDQMVDANKKVVDITNIEVINYEKPITTYNLTVEGNSNYYVTNIQLLVHNASPVEEIIP